MDGYVLTYAGISGERNAEMITPLDIQNKEFAKGVRGYKEEEVDSFLDLLTIDLEKLLSENTALKEQNKRLSKELDKYKGSESTVVETLEAAKGLMREIAVSSEKRAEILLKNAELDAQLITREAKESIERLTEESQALRTRYENFRNRYKSMLESELERFDTFSNEIFSEFGEADVKTAERKKERKSERSRKSQRDEKGKEAEGTREIPAGREVKRLSDIENNIDNTVDDLKKTMVNLRLGEGAE